VGRILVVPEPHRPTPDPPLTVQLHADDGQCWEATYDVVTAKPGARFAAK